MPLAEREEEETPHQLHPGTPGMRDALGRRILIPFGFQTSKAELSEILKSVEVNTLNFRVASVAQSVKRPTLDFGSGHDFMVCSFEPHAGLCTDSLEFSLSLPLLAPVSQNKYKLKKNSWNFEISGLCSGRTRGP